MARSLEELNRDYERLRAVHEIENIMGRYSFLHTAMHHIDYLKLWSKRDDCKLEMPWVAYEGYAGVERCYLKDHGDRSMPEIGELLKGLLCVHCIGTGVVEVAEDGQTARGVWISPGFETANEARRAPGVCGPGANTASTLFWRTGPGRSGRCVFTPIL